MAIGNRGALIALVAVLAVVGGAAVALSIKAQDVRDAAAPSLLSSAQSRFTVVAGPLGDRKTAVFVMDAQTMRLMVYAVDAETRLLKLIAVRDISEDVRLSHWGNERPWPEEIRQRAEAGEGGG